MVSAVSSKVLHYLDTPDVLSFVGSARAEALAAKGTTCPDHFLRTKVKPLFVPFAPGRETAEDLLARLPKLIEQYTADYIAYYDRCKRPNSPAMRDPYPVVVLIPGLGLLSFQKDKQTARVAAEYYVNTINVMRWAEGVDEYAPISEQDAFEDLANAVRETGIGLGGLAGALVDLVGHTEDPFPHRDEAIHLWGYLLAGRQASAATST